MLSLKRIHWKLKLWVVWLRNFEGSNLTFDLQRSTQVKIVLLFESPYIIVPYLLSIDTFYLEVFFRRSTSKSSIDTFSLSRTVFEIFDFKVFRVWPLTFRGYLRSKLYSSFESPYMIYYLTSIDTSSLSHTLFEIFDFKDFKVWPWPSTFRCHLRSKNIFIIRKPIHDFLPNFHFFSISYRFRHNWIQGFQGLTLTFDL